VTCTAFNIERGDIWLAGKGVDLERWKIRVGKRWFDRKRKEFGFWARGFDAKRREIGWERRSLDLKRREGCRRLGQMDDERSSFGHDIRGERLREEPVSAHVAGRGEDEEMGEEDDKRRKFEPHVDCDKGKDRIWRIQGWKSRMEIKDGNQ
jgi:hypothetical protein